MRRASGRGVIDGGGFTLSSLEVKTMTDRELGVDDIGDCDLCGERINMKAGDVCSTIDLSEEGIQEWVETDEEVDTTEIVEAYIRALEWGDPEEINLRLAQLFRERSEVAAHDECLNQTRIFGSEFND